MGRAVVGDVVVVPFPYPDLSHSKRRPALVVAEAEFGDVILCQITSRSYLSSNARRVTSSDFASGGLNRDSFVRPDKLFTASGSIVLRIAGTLAPEALKSIRETAAQLFR